MTRNHRYEIHLTNGVLFAVVETKQLKTARKQILTEIANAMKHGVSDFTVNYVDLNLYQDSKPWKEFL